ncbi:MAG: acetyl-CoA carboxylase biotin carboxylase subunit [Clostridiales bacterium]|nr:acetyl-CoA carboxylase biotin carboxylase subunit [Clostridiales bacterium]
MFPKILIANRGEIAVRVIRACKEMGVSTVAVYSEADRDALHVSLADEGVCIGPAPALRSYLNMQAVLSAAAVTGARAIHPGYGLLSENARFAELCAKNRVKFIGPSADAIRRMGDKDCARRTMREAGVPVVPGCDLVEGEAQARECADRVGYPILIKARAGGGGRGIRRVDSADELGRCLRAATMEAQAAFGDGAVYIERCLTQVKHVEVQLLCDGRGNVACLVERDCSMQRRNQKLIEESPSPAVTPQVRAAMYAAAAAAARAVGYEGVGTVEFLLTRDGQFYFMEMNTRLQVEHPVTEMVTGVDLVKWQIRVAAGGELPFGQDDVRVSGHAIECRINAENPDLGFRPSCGRVTLLHVPGGPQVRFDTALYQGYSVPPFYDSMIGKLIVHAPTREEAVRKMRSALCEMVIEGLDHNGGFQSELLGEPAFADGSYTTEYLEGRG